MNKQLKDFSTTELKAIAYDMIAQIEQNQMTIKAINQELATRVQAENPAEIVEEVEEKKD